MTGASRRSCRIAVLLLAVLGLSVCHEGVFAQPVQKSSYHMRQQNGLDVHTEVDNSLQDPAQPEEKKLIAQLGEAGRRGRWKQTERILGRYAGGHPTVLAARMHAAFRCSKYKEAEKLFDKLRHASKALEPPAYTIAMKLLGKLGRVEEVEELWTELVQDGKVNKINAQGRIDAAASAGDIESAVSILRWMEEH